MYPYIKSEKYLVFSFFSHWEGSCNLCRNLQRLNFHFMTLMSLNRNNLIFIVNEVHNFLLISE